MNSSADLQDKQTVLIVDDTPDNISLLAALLKGKYKIKIATNGLKALQIVTAPPYPDLILLDVMMPELDGHETCRRLKSNPDTADIPVIFLTAKSQVEDEEMGLNLGAADYIAKPISPPIVFARVANQLNLKNARHLLANQAQHLTQLVAERTRELAQMQEATVLALSSLVESRNHESVSHILRVQHIVAALARALSSQDSQASPNYRLDARQIDFLYQASALHDIGMISVPEHILHKPGKLDEAEFALVKQHTLYGRDAINAVEQQFGQAADFLRFAREIALSHHEKWEGTGYPQQLAGENIPLAARLTAVADVYDALISKRIYKPALSHEQAMRIMFDGKGRHFDPQILDAFCSIEAQVQQIAKRFEDGQ